MRLLYDSTYIAHKRGKSIRNIPRRKIDEYSFKVNKEKKCFERTDKPDHRSSNSKSKGYWIRIKKHVDSIYRWDNKFRFTTIVICTYTVAFIFLFHLTGTVILLYQTPTNVYIRYARDIFQFLLNIGMYTLTDFPCEWFFVVVVE